MKPRSKFSLHLRRTTAAATDVAEASSDVVLRALIVLGLIGAVAMIALGAIVSSMG